MCLGFAIPDLGLHQTHNVGRINILFGQFVNSVNLKQQSMITLSVVNNIL